MYLTYLPVYSLISESLKLTMKTGLVKGDVYTLTFEYAGNATVSATLQQYSLHLS